MLKCISVQLPFTYIAEVRSELARVVWPKRAEVVRLTGMVIAISAAVALYTGVLDLAFTKLLEALVSR